MNRWPMVLGAGCCIAAAVAIVSCDRRDATDGVSVRSYRVVERFAHDPQAFTQGLVYDDGFLYEGTGQYGESSLRKVGLRSGDVLQKLALEGRYFGEGIAIVGDRIIQLTWRAGVGFVYDKDTFRRVGQFEYDGQGWGLAYDGTRLIMSDGTQRLRFLDADTFEETVSIDVHVGDRPVTDLNELEYIRGDIWANIYRQDRIAIIDPADGHVKALVDLTGLLEPRARRRADVLNGIAYDNQEDRIFVTGKYWPAMFQIEVMTPLP